MQSGGRSGRRRGKSGRRLLDGKLMMVQIALGHFFSLGPQGKSLRYERQIVYGTALHKKWLKIKKIAPWYFEVNRLMNNNPAYKPIGVGNNDTLIDFSAFKLNKSEHDSEHEDSEEKNDEEDSDNDGPNTESEDTEAEDNEYNIILARFKRRKIDYEPNGYPRETERSTESPIQRDHTRAR
ncbi:hypothetical protein BDQ17DRAFT_1106885 [Cyathus striatus]|nr:hypothetical protein BDQ17DRAFT_1106885 [Cyathus striatus]